MASSFERVPYHVYLVIKMKVSKDANMAFYAGIRLYSQVAMILHMST